MALTELIKSLYQNGLGELYILHATNDKVFFGNMYYEKGRLVLKDKKLLTDMKPAVLRPCWESGRLGLLCNSPHKSWESLTFYGLEQCDLPVDLSRTRHGALTAAENQYGDQLIDFVGSVYRGYHLMLDNHFLPVILLNEARTKNGETGLIISDLLTAPMSISLIRALNDVIRRSVEKYLILEVDDVELNKEQFDQLFGNYLT